MPHDDAKNSWREEVRAMRAESIMAVPEQQVDSVHEMQGTTA